MNFFKMDIAKKKMFKRRNNINNNMMIKSKWKNFINPT